MSEAENDTAPTSTDLKIPVVKGGTGAYVLVNTERVDIRIYTAALAAGFKLLANGGASKITKPADEDDKEAMDKFHKAAVAKAEERVLAMYDGSLKLGRGAGTVKGPSGAVTNEARRIARQLVKDALRENGLRVSHFSASEITAQANAMLTDSEVGPGLFRMAEENLNKRTSTNVKVDIGKMKADPKLVAKAEERKAVAKAGQLSAAKASKVAPRVSKALQ